MKNLKEILLDGYGFLTEDSLKDLKAIMGENFKVVARTYEHDRLLVTIKEFECLDKEIVDDIRDVFIPADTYNKLNSLV